MKSVKDLAKAQSVPDLLRSLQMEPHVFRDVLSNLDSHYKQRLVRKRRGRVNRTVWEVTGPLKDLHRQIRDWFTAFGKRTEIATAFWDGSAPAKNARFHLRAAVVTVADIRDFFGHITTERVAAAAESLGCAEVVARTISRIATYRGSLPQGARSSPVISNVVCDALDRDLGLFAKERGLVVSRYVDDIAFSGDQPISRTEISKLLKGHGFELRESAYRSFRKGGPQIVTGMSVADHEHGIVRLPRNYKRRFRLECYYVATRGVEAHAAAVGKDPLKEANRLRGHIYYAIGVEHRVAVKYRTPALARIELFLATVKR